MRPRHSRPTIRESAVELTCIAGFQASKRQSLPGVLKLWAVLNIFAPRILFHRTMEADE